MTDGNSRVVTINLTTGATVGDVTTKAGDPNRAVLVACVDDAVVRYLVDGTAPGNLRC